MGIFELFTKRMKKSQEQPNDVYQYENFPHEFRVQVVHIVQDAIGNDIRHNQFPNQAYFHIQKTLCREYGKFYLDKEANTNFESIFNYFLRTKISSECLDIIDLTFNVIDNHVRNNIYMFQQSSGWNQQPDDAIEELNYRFREAAIGYQFENGKLIKIDSQLVHNEVVKPTLYFLGSKPEYSGANDEFLSAHEHYRHKRYKECLNDCLKSFESIMKAIHGIHTWTYNPNDTSKKLINSCLQNNLVPEYMQNQFASIRTLLESGIPTIRNKEGGHGQGLEINNIPEHLASYAIHLTASNILFLVRCSDNFS